MVNPRTQITPDISIDDLTPEEANRIIHSHRKVRYGTACWPCRQRKVKCDNQQPCENCVRRDHPQLCSYKPNRSASSRNQTQSVHPASAPPTTAPNTSVPPSLAAPATITTSTTSTASSTAATGTIPSSSLVDDHARRLKRPHSPDSQSESATSLPPAHRHASWPPRAMPLASVDNDAEAPESATRYLGHNSIPSLLREQSASNDQQHTSDIRQDMRSILGLDTSAPFPLMSSRHLDAMTRDICSELPSDREVMKLFRTYKETPQQFWGFVVDMDDLESNLMVYLEDRARNARGTTKNTRPVSASWLAILFAVLAVGSQYHDSPYHVRTRDSQKYIQISFHFLRLGNFLLRPNFDSIQALLLTSFVLLNDMKAEASWALLGLTCRLAQSLGLHRPTAPSPQNGDREKQGGERDVVDKNQNRDKDDLSPPQLKSKDWVRRKLWWTCVWHDTLTSLSFDRSPVTNFPCCAIPTAGPPETGNFSYLETMYHLCQFISNRLNPDSTTTVSYDQIIDNCQAVESLRAKGASHLRCKEHCKSAIDRLQFYGIRLHTAFVISVCCRPALHRDGHQLTPAQRDFLVGKCQENLIETVRMFLAMHQLSVIPTRSWAYTYHGLSSALLLGILGETKACPDVRQLQGDLIAALSATAVKGGQVSSSASSPGGLHVPHTDKDIELSGPLWRALTALRNIYEHGSVVGSSAASAAAAAVAAVKRESDTGTGSGNPSGPATPLHHPQHHPHQPQHPHQQSIAGAAAPPQALATPASFSSGLSGQQQQQQQPGAGNDAVNNMPPMSHRAALQGLDPRQDAALAMAEMQQNGTPLQQQQQQQHEQQQQQQQQHQQPQQEQQQGFGPYPPPLLNTNAETPVGPIDAGMANLDPSTYMSPLDLYESIWWESPDPWNSGLDSFNFEFAAQPPPGQPQQQYYF